MWANLTFFRRRESLGYWVWGWKYWLFSHYKLWNLFMFLIMEVELMRLNLLRFSRMIKFPLSGLNLLIRSMMRMIINFLFLLLSAIKCLPTWVLYCYSGLLLIIVYYVIQRLNIVRHLFKSLNKLNFNFLLY